MPFRIVERIYSHVEERPSIMLANIHVSTNIQENLRKIEQVVEMAHEQEVNILIFPEFCVTGYIWEAENDKEIIDHLMEGESGRLTSWMNNLRDSMNGDGRGLEYIFLNNARLVGADLYNSTFVLNPNFDYNQESIIYDKIFLPYNELRYFKRGSDKRMAIDTKWGRFGFLTCYDLAFVELAREYAFTDDVDAIVTLSAWRSEAIREYPHMNIRTDHYYGFLWNLMNASKAAYCQVWSIGVNAVGTHDISGSMFWGGSGVWAPSGLQILQASNMKEELIVIRNLDITEQKFREKDEFDYRIDFQSVYRKMEETGRYTRYLP